jgi:small subunit ribosomal protein S2
VADPEKLGDVSKKELSSINRSIEKYKKSLDGIKEMTRLPDAVFIVDVGRESIAVKEANRLGIPIVAIVDSNCDPESIDFVVPGNDDSTRAIQLYCQRVADACAEGAWIFNERVQSQVSEQERARATGEVAEKTGTGRVVVEIKQQPRRGRGTHSAAPRAERERGSGGGGEPAEREEPAEAPSAPAPASE